MSITANSTALASDVIILKQTFDLKHIAGYDYISLVTSDVPAYHTGSSTVMYLHIPGQSLQTRDITADWAAADKADSIVIEGAYLYALLQDNGTSTYRVYRYDKTNLAAGGTLMTISGTAFGTTGTIMIMTSNGSGTFYFSTQGNNSASRHIFSKYTLSGTTLTFSANVTCGATSANFTQVVGVDASGNIYGQGSDNAIRKYNSAGTLQSTSAVWGTGGPFYKMAGVTYINVGASPNPLYSIIDL